MRIPRFVGKGRICSARNLVSKVQHILEVLDELRVAGLLKTEGFEESKLTFHDPCQLVRRGGVV